MARILTDPCYCSNQTSKLGGLCYAYAIECRRVNTMQPAPHLNNEDWLHLEQTIKMLYLAVAQIETALGEGNEEASLIGQAMTAINQQLAHLRQTGADETVCANIEENLMNAVTAFQFYDRMSQRVDHVQAGLRHLIQVMGDQHDIHNPEAWQHIQQEIKASYTMEAERLMFDKIMQGMPLDEALAIFRHNFRGHDTVTEDDDGDIVELF